MLQTLLFYVFSGVLLTSGLMVVASRNPVHAVLFLILCFFNVAGLFLLIGAEFLAMILVIIYVGAVAVLFLFVVMMLDINFVELRRGFVRYLPAGLAVAGIFGAELAFFGLTAKIAPHAAEAVAPVADNTRAIGMVLYTDYVYPFEVSGLILLVAMIGAIVLTLRHKTDLKRQNPRQQLDVKRGDVVRLTKVANGGGVE
ncbi:MAG: NADH-quinone oxidoreductase subunit J [Alphaproteobacteria bacterium]